MQRVGGAGEDRVDGAGRDPRAEQLLAQLDDIAAAHAVAHRQGHDRRLQARPERACGDLDGEPTGAALPAAGATHPVAPVLGHAHGHHRQLLDLMARRLAVSGQVSCAEDVTAGAPGRPVLDDLVDRPRRQQRAALALMPGLSARRAARGILAAPRRRARRIGARRLRRVARGPGQLALQRHDPLVLSRDPVGQLLDLRLKPFVLRRKRQQDPNNGIAAPLIDRLGLAPLHTTSFDSPRLCPPTN